MVGYTTYRMEKENVIHAYIYIRTGGRKHGSELTISISIHIVILSRKITMSSPIH